MPLSVLGKEEVTVAAKALRVPVHFVEAGNLYDRTASHAIEMIAAGATLHFPSLLVYHGRSSGTAILGYKTAKAYKKVIQQALATQQTLGTPHEVSDRNNAGLDMLTQSEPASAQTSVLRPLQSSMSWRDFPISGRPEPYFRAIPKTDWLAWEMDQTVHLLNMRLGTLRLGPGKYDFIPSPDGRLFVTPGRLRLEFYDAREVLGTGPTGGKNARVIYVDPSMLDQYPSIGILSDQGNVVTYRVLTSWEIGVAYRDYKVHYRPTNGPLVEPLGSRVEPCKGMELSIPILSRDGKEIGARDQTSATTKIYRIEDGACSEVLDLRLQTGKLAFGPDNRLIAFAIPEGVEQSTPANAYGFRNLSLGNLAGVFVFDRNTLRITKVDGSADVNRLTFPDFVGSDSIIFLTTSASRSGAFRLVCCIGRE